MDAITLLKDDHKVVEDLFKRFEKAGDRAFATKRDLVDRIIEALSTHAAVEEQLFYPVTRATVPDTDDIVLESMEEHHVAKWLLDELLTMDPTDERFDAKVTVLIENVRHHVEEEEQDYFPKVRDELGRNALSDLGDAMVAAKAVAPTKPHPRSPQTPPGNMLVGLVAGTADRIGDTALGLARGGLDAAQDLVALALGRPRPRRAVRGSSVSRSTERRIRAQATSATESLIGSIESARDAGEATTDAARSGAKATVTSARRGTASTASAAKGTANSAKNGAANTTRAAKASVTTAKKGASRTKTTVKRAATTTARAAQKR